ncbi:MAG: DUF1800 domain-containing protein [Vicinamibacterales bacterium]
MAGTRPIDHLLRRAGFGASPDERVGYFGLSFNQAVDQLIDYERQPDDIDAKVGTNGYLGVTTRGGQYAPNTVINDSRQRWLFRMTHTERPLQEKMALFWHNHFATTYSKVAGFAGATQGARMMAGKPGEVPGPPGQYELFRQHALGNFRDLLLAVARDPAMVVFLDGRTNTRTRPQENFGREIMELFTWGVGNYTEPDVYAAARVFTGWNLRTSGVLRDVALGYYEFFYNAGQHDVTAKTFTFPIYANGDKTIPARTAAGGEQDGIDLINALATHPETARRLARKLWGFFVSEAVVPDEAFVANVASVYLQNNTSMRATVRYILGSAWFQSPDAYYARYAWPVEYAVKSIKEVGWNGYSIDSARAALPGMGQTLFEPPDVAGWSLGTDWFGTGSMLARMNFAAGLAGNQRFVLGRDAQPYRATPDGVLDYFLARYTPLAFDSTQRQELAAYLRAGGAWTGSDTQLNAKAAGLTRLITGSGEYQFI